MSETTSIYDLVEYGTLTIDQVLSMAFITMPDHEYRSNGEIVFDQFSSYDPLDTSSCFWATKQQLAIRDFLINRGFKMCRDPLNDGNFLCKPMFPLSYSKGFSVSACSIDLCATLAAVAVLEGE